MSAIEPMQQSSTQARADAAGPQPVLRLTGVTKEFAGVTALSDVSMVV